MKTILICIDAEHAEFVDQLVFERIKEEEGAVGNGWSGVLTDGKQFGILWADPVSALFGQPSDFPELQLVEDTDDSWTTYTPEPDSGSVGVL